MALVSLTDVTFSYSHPPLLNGVTLRIDAGEKIGLVGRNGAGKSTLMKLIAGELDVDNGNIEYEAHSRIAYLTQHVPAGDDRSIFEHVSDGLGPIGKEVVAFHQLNEKMSAGETLTAAEQKTFDKATDRLGDADGWELQSLVERTLGEMNLDAEQAFSSLSAGLKRRVLLARALVTQPHVLLLDEPTNHLDLSAILWLESYLARFAGTLIFVTHDRAFLQSLARRIVEVERGRLFDWTCDYKTFLVRRDAFLAAEAEQQAQFDKKLAEEERWIRQGIKARRTRNEGRVRALKKLREERRERREQTGTAKMQVQQADRSGRMVLRAKKVSFSYGEQDIFRGFSMTIERGDRVGIIGPNGVGKSTLLKTLLGELKPQAGTVDFGTNLEVSYFDQLRMQLDENKSARDTVADGADQVLVNGARRHVVGYLQDFLFSPERSQIRVGALSGGERNRLLLAKLFTKPSNVLVLDEPTNDLDAETLDLLEELLGEYAGTVLLVSHDRAFLNDVVTSTLVFEGEGILREYDGGYDDWQRAVAARGANTDVAKELTAASGKTSADKTGTSSPPAKNLKKLTFKERQELAELPAQIEAWETEQAALNEQIADPAFYQQDREDIALVTNRIERLATDLTTAYTRWEDLEAREQAE